jgi:hypothetical protein
MGADRIVPQPGDAGQEKVDDSIPTWAVTGVRLDRTGTETNIEVEVAGRLDDPALKTLGLEYGRVEHRSRYAGRMVVLAGTEYDGVWIPLGIAQTSTSSTLRLWAPYDSTDGWTGRKWRVEPLTDMRREEGQTICIAAAEPEGSSPGAATLQIAPRIKLHTRATVFWIDKIDTVEQCFKAKVFWELRARALADYATTEEQRDEFLSVYGLSKDRSPGEFLNIVEQDAGETWFNLSSGDHVPGKQDLCWKGNCTATFSERMELEDFPLDIQAFQVPSLKEVPRVRGTP